MKFRKRFLMVFMSLTLLVGMMGGNSVLAEGTKDPYMDMWNLSPTQVDKLFPVTTEQESLIIHKIPSCPVIIDGILFEAEKISYFDGRRLDFVYGADGNLYAFTDAKVAEEFLRTEFPLNLSDNGARVSGLNYFYEHWNYGGEMESFIPYEGCSNLGYYYGFDDCISSMKTVTYVSIYDNVNYQGDRWNFGPDNWWLIGGANDKASSFTSWD